MVVKPMISIFLSRTSEQTVWNKNFTILVYPKTFENVDLIIPIKVIVIPSWPWCYWQYHR